MNIGIVMKQYDSARVLQEHLAVVHEVTVYLSAEDCIKAVLEARFRGQPLHTLILTEMDLGKEMSGPRMIRSLRFFLKKNELTFILLNGRSAREEEIARQNLLDSRVRLMPRDTVQLYQEIQKVAGGNR